MKNTQFSVKCRYCIPIHQGAPPFSAAAGIALRFTMGHCRALPLALARLSCCHSPVTTTNLRFTLIPMTHAPDTGDSILSWRRFSAPVFRAI